MKTIAFENPDEKAALERSFAKLRQINQERDECVALAKPALDRLAKMMIQRSGQAFKVRSFLWSLYNGQPVSLLEVVSLDWPVRADVCAVILAFGAPEFFYSQFKETFRTAGIFPWFCEEGGAE